MSHHHRQHHSRGDPACTLSAAVAALAGFASVATGGEPCAADWDPTLGQPGMEDEFAPQVLAVSVYNDDLYAGGQFDSVDGQTMNHIARWDGSMWQPLVSGGEIGVDSERVEALTIYNDELIVGGFFTSAGGQMAIGIARWDGSEWDSFDAKTVPSITTNALAVYDGDLIAGGSFTSAYGGGQTFNGIARWDGTQWHPLVSGGEIGVNHPQTDGRVDAGMEVYNGDLYVGGNFVTAGGQTVNGIARWDGTQWHPLVSGGETGTTGSSALAVYDDELIVSGPTTVGGQTVNEIARWDGTQWRAFPSCGGPIGVSGGGSSVFAMTDYNGQLIAGGLFTEAGGYEANRIAAWNGCPLRGACCINGTAVQLYEDECAAAGGVFHGEEVPSEDVTCGQPCPADLTGDQQVNVLDLLDMLEAWGACP